MPNVNSNASFWKDGDVITADKLNSSSVLIIEGDATNGLSANGPTFEELWANKDKCYLILKTPMIGPSGTFVFAPLGGINTASSMFLFVAMGANFYLHSDGTITTSSNSSIPSGDQTINPGDSNTSN